MTEKTIYTDQNVDIWLEDGLVYVSTADRAASVPAADFFSAVEDFLTLNSALIWEARDEREAAVMQDAVDWYVDHEAEPGISRNAFLRGYDDGLAAAARKHPEPEVTDDMVERAARAHHIFVWGDDLDPHFPMPRDERLAMRTALEAALNPEGRRRMTDQEARDEREALQRLIYTFETIDLGDNLAITTRDSYALADAILAAGYRKQPKPAMADQETIMTQQSRSIRPFHANYPGMPQLYHTYCTDHPDFGTCAEEAQAHRDLADHIENEH